MPSMPAVGKNIYTALKSVGNIKLPSISGMRRNKYLKGELKNLALLSSRTPLSLKNI
jgi:hypothetical protein